MTYNEGVNAFCIFHSKPFKCNSGTLTLPRCTNVFHMTLWQIRKSNLFPKSKYFFLKPRMTPKWPPNDPQWPPMTHQWTPSEPPMTTNDNQLGHFWFPDVEKLNFTFKFWKEPIFPQFYRPNYRINSQTRNFLEFFNKKTPTKN